MASLKVIRKRIASVKSTQQITKAMKMVAAAKLRRAQEAAQQARPYTEKLAGLLSNVAARVGEEHTHPLLATREAEREVDLVVVTADRGLCGAFNTNLIRVGEQFLRERRGAGVEVRLTLVGRKGYDYFKKRKVEIATKHVNLFGGPGHELANEVAEGLARRFAAAQSDGAYIVFSHFRSAMTQVPTLERLLPVSRAEALEGGGDEQGEVDYIYEPDVATLLDRLLLQYVTALVGHAFLETIASEHGARMTAMDSATSNAKEMIERLTLAMNRARQAAITKELMEIVGGAEALKG
jgi:F-type H+-transporting ATPase subunit gamma